MFLWKGIANLKPSDKRSNYTEPKRLKLDPVFAAAARVAVSHGRSVGGAPRVSKALQAADDAARIISEGFCICQLVLFFFSSFGSFFEVMLCCRSLVFSWLFLVVVCPGYSHSIHFENSGSVIETVKCKQA